MNEDPVIPESLDRRDVTTFKEAAEFVHDLESIFKKLSIAIPQGSDFEEVWLHTVEMENKRRGITPIDPTEDIRPTQRKVLGLLDLAVRIVRAHERGDTSAMREHLELMTQCTFAQNIKSLAEEGSNKVFELLMGLVCSEIGSDICMDSPTAARGDNPDILMTVDGSRWGIACKVLNGYSALTMFERIEEGIEQIEASEANVGCVAINLKNVIDHNYFWPILRHEEDEPIYGVWPDFGKAARDLADLAAKTHFRLEDDNSLEEIERILQNKKTVNGVLLFLQTAIGVSLGEKSVPTSLGILNVMRFGDIPKKHFSVLRRMNEVLHNRE